MILRWVHRKKDNDSNKLGLGYAGLMYGSVSGCVCFCDIKHQS